ncbi:MAG: PqqD family protein [Clostridia bacterium]|nr:PqqD family protein [Clostridia bacterium]
MKIKQGFALRRFADKWIAVSCDELADTRNVLITLNKTAAFAWEQLEKGTDRAALLEALCDRFDVERDVASRDLDAFLQKAREAGILDDES